MEGQERLQKRTLISFLALLLLLCGSSLLSRRTTSGDRPAAAGPRNRQCPDAVVVGAPKCGTAAIRHMLGTMHPLTVWSGAEEVSFFNRPGLGLEWYLRQFPAGVRGDQVLMEKSPDYLGSPGAPSGILQVAGQ